MTRATDAGAPASKPEKFTPLQLDVLRAACLAYARDPEAWSRAASLGERVTFASLYRRGALERRAWRGREGEADAAFEYRPAEPLRLEVDALRSTPPARGAPPAP